jgi:hypothetical protein
VPYIKTFITGDVSQKKGIPCGLQSSRVIMIDFFLGGILPP